MRAGREIASMTPSQYALAMLEQGDRVEDAAEGVAAEYGISLEDAADIVSCAYDKED